MLAEYATALKLLVNALDLSNFTLAVQVDSALTQNLPVRSLAHLPCVVSADSFELRSRSATELSVVS